MTENEKGLADDCVWGAAIDRAHAQRAVPTLPDGWRREFESHYSCGPYYLLFERPTPGDGPDPRPVITACPNGISFGYLDHVDPDELKVLCAVIDADARWLGAWTKRYAHVCATVVDEMRTRTKAAAAPRGIRQHAERLLSVLREPLPRDNADALIATLPLCANGCGAATHFVFADDTATFACPVCTDVHGIAHEMPWCGVVSAIRWDE